MMWRVCDYGINEMREYLSGISDDSHVTEDR